MLDVRRREVLTLLGGAVAVWPIAARAQQPDRMRRIGVLMSVADGPEGKARLGAFLEGLQQLGWTDGRNVRIETGHDQCRRPSQTRGIKRRPHQAKALGHLDLAIQFASPRTANSATAPGSAWPGRIF